MWPVGEGEEKPGFAYAVASTGRRLGATIRALAEHDFEMRDWGGFLKTSDGI